jgi:predicted RNA binding protein YcfA (HicA-like mRNA interferase family)
MKIREAGRMIEQDGCCLAAMRGSHRQFKHPSKTGRVTGCRKSSLNSLLKQAALKEQR